MSHRITTTTAAFLPRLVKLAVAGGLIVGLAACDTYLARRDTVTLGAGDSVRGNIALHTDDFWPRQAFNRDVPLAGSRAVTNVRAYNRGAGTSAPATSSGTTN